MSVRNRKKSGQHGNNTTGNYEVRVQDLVTGKTYDANGNRTMSGYVTGAANQITSDGTWTYTYDNEGNLIKKSMGPSAEKRARPNSTPRP